jgi:hypothetical protein
MPYRSILSSRRRRALPVAVGAACLVVGVIIGHGGGTLRIRELEGRVAELSQ